MKRTVLLLLILSVCFCLCACSKNTTASETTQLTATPSENEIVTEDTVTYETDAVTEYITQSEETAVIKDKVQNNSATAAETVTETATASKYKRTGKMKFSDSEKNKYLSAVAEKYSLEPKNLVAVYTVPDNDGNLVLEFSGTGGLGGKPLRNAATLVNIYTVDKDLNSKKASRIPAESDYDTNESNAIFFVTTTYIMPEFEAELKG
ncbi:MAG: hypothetical protein ACI4IF_00600 [Acutalibacteraceae bacterium]